MNHHQICGRHSGISSCCIEWFVTTWSNYIYEDLDLRSKYLKANGSVGYIRCPMCIANKIVIEIKGCDCYDTEK